MTGLNHKAISTVATRGNVQFSHACQLFCYLRLGLGQRALAIMFGKAQATLSQELNETLSKVVEPMTNEFLRRPREQVPYSLLLIS